MSNKTSDNSVANIEENIKTIKNLLQMLENGFLTEEMCPIRSWDPTPKYASALKYILAEREQDKKRIQELEEQLRKYYNGELYTAKQLKNLVKQKEKQIDLMADFMYKTGTGRKALSCVFGQNDECNENGCEYCIKRYFAGLVEKE